MSIKLVILNCLKDLSCSLQRLKKEISLLYHDDDDNDYYK